MAQFDTQITINEITFDVPGRGKPRASVFRAWSDRYSYHSGHADQVEDIKTGETIWRGEALTYGKSIADTKRRKLTETEKEAWRLFLDAITKMEDFLEAETAMASAARKVTTPEAIATKREEAQRRNAFYKRIGENGEF